MARLEGKDILITGGTTGIGFACARLFLDEGARVAITGRGDASLAAAREALDGRVVTIRADVTDVADIERMAVAADVGSSACIIGRPITR